MKHLTNIFDFCLNASIWVALSVVSFVKITYFNLGIEASSILECFVFFGTIFGYNSIKYFEKEQFKGTESNFFKINFKEAFLKFKTFNTHKKLTFVMSQLSLLICVFLALRLSEKTLAILCVPVLLTLFYAVSFGKRNLRSTSGVKIYVVGLVWALMTVLLPVVSAEVEIDSDVWLIFAQRVLFVVVLIIPFEIRDLKVDEESLGTLPQKVGVKNTKLIGVLFLIIFFLLEFFKNELIVSHLTALLLIVTITVFLVMKSTVKQSKYYASFFVEGIPILWLVLLLML